ncbi:hypothetical protein M8C21_032072 [Ambrosia artemisiifolia]|uniref:Uncharacterized protein n=1 Tax=Ambrosia artemisiifolia TaxID=4212 RepID=A0AAD5GFC6_AMBAR|nr:hypothetical protein M8C21_032072 [Ambrosia artemisiifolia]
MPAVRHCSRVDTFELKIQMETSLGAQKSESYFNLLTRYLSLKLGKSEFDKLCIRLIGRENIRLHNELIKAILKNAAVCKTPPPKQVKHDNLLTFKDPNGGLQSICRDVFLQSPRKGRTPIVRERKFKDRPSPLGLDDKNHMAEVYSEQDALSRSSYRRIPITAPFGINIYSNESRKVSCSDSGSGYYTETCHYSGQFLSRNSLENRLKHKLKSEGGINDQPEDAWRRLKQNCKSCVKSRKPQKFWIKDIKLYIRLNADSRGQDASRLIFPLLPFLTPTRPSLVMAATNALLKACVLDAHEFTVCFDLESVKSTWSELCYPREQSCRLGSTREQQTWH